MKKLLLVTSLLASMCAMNVQATNCVINTNNGESDYSQCSAEEIAANEGTIIVSQGVLQQISQNSEDIAYQGASNGMTNSIQYGLIDSNTEAISDISLAVSENQDDIKDLEIAVEVNGVENWFQQQEINNNTSVNTLQDVRMEGMDAFVQEQQLYNTSFSDSINSNSNRISTLETKTKQLTKGVAMAGALAMGAGLHTIDHDGRFTLIPSIVSYDGETALAIQTQIAFNNHMSIRLGYSNTADDFVSVKDGMVGGAATFSF